MKKLNVYIVPTQQIVYFPYQPIRLRASDMQFYNPKANNNYLGLVPLVDQDMDGVKRIQRLSQYGTLVSLMKEEYTIYSSTRVYSAITFARCKIDQIVKSSPYYLATVEILSDEIPNEAALLPLVTELKLKAKTYLEYFSLGSQPLNFDHETNINKLFYTLANQAELSFHSKLLLLQNDSHESRIAQLTQHLKGKIEEFSAAKELENKVKKEILQPTTFPAVPKQPLPQTAANHQIAKLESRIQSTKLPEHVKEVVDEEFAKLKQPSLLNPENNIARNYIELLLALPWQTSVPDSLSIQRCKETLDHDHFGLKRAKERILQFLAVKHLTQGATTQPGQGQIICFHGPPGVGKTSLGKSIAQALGRPFQRIALGGVSDEAQIRGHRRTYVGAMPGVLINAIKKAKCKNPVILLDEIDKLTSTARGDPSSALLEVLDPEQNAHFVDNYVNLEFDLSQVLFITTANYIDQIQPALRDRLELIEIEGYSTKEKIAIAQSYLIPKQLSRSGLTPQHVDISVDTIRVVIKEYTSEAGVRQLERRVATLFRNVALRLVNQSETGAVIPRLTIGPEQIIEMLGPSVYSSKQRSPDIIVPGVAKGLAWTPMGGSVLVIETVRMEGKGRFEITGMLGEVMKESVKTALGLIKAYWPQIKQLSKELSDVNFDRMDLHVHFPAGAIPKDGPSAGITITTAIASLLTGLKVKSDLAMTGEVTLTGRVLPVGGIKDKLLGAYEAGIRSVIIPHQNRNNLVEVDQEVRESLEIHTVKTIDEVLLLALEGTSGMRVKLLNNYANL